MANLVQTPVSHQTLSLLHVVVYALGTMRYVWDLSAYTLILRILHEWWFRRHRVR